ncbi:octaprenyl-diphosphate synthase [Actinobacillus pleuropneumoniae]|nr:octaprenyl-diphosphate synthase [Actinobacillus pleuropneumoniae]
MHTAQEKGNQAQVDIIRSAIENGGEREQIPAVLEIMAEHQSLEYAMTRAKQEAQKAVDALAVLPESEYKQALISLAYLSVDSFVLISGQIFSLFYNFYGRTKPTTFRT